MLDKILKVKDSHFLFFHIVQMHPAYYVTGIKARFPKGHMAGM